MLEAPELPSLTRHVRTHDGETHVLRLAWFSDVLATLLADGNVLLRDGEDERSIPVHGDSALVGATDGERLITGGADGRVKVVHADGRVDNLTHVKGRWIDAVATGPQRAVAWSAGQHVGVATHGESERAQSAPSSVRGIAFAHKGLRLAYAHYDGASLWYPHMTEAPTTLAWKGSHLDVTWSPDSRFVVTSMQENTLHGWRLPEKQHMRMAGYPSKSRSLSWSHDGKWLATSGAEAAIIWSFAEKTGPMGKPPRECGVRPSRVSQVAFHPKAYVLAIGYEDSCILLCRLGDAAELLVRPAVREGGQISALAWDRHGARLAYGTASGHAGTLVVPKKAD